MHVRFLITTGHTFVDAKQLHWPKAQIESPGGTLGRSSADAHPTLPIAASSPDESALTRVSREHLLVSAIAGEWRVHDISRGGTMLRRGERHAAVRRAGDVFALADRLVLAGVVELKVIELVGAEETSADIGDPSRTADPADPAMAPQIPDLPLELERFAFEFTAPYREDPPRYVYADVQESADAVGFARRTGYYRAAQLAELGHIKRLIGDARNK